MPRSKSAELRIKVIDCCLSDRKRSDRFTVADLTGDAFALKGLQELNK